MHNLSSDFCPPPSAKATLAVDFETYYDKDYSLKKMDAWSYVHHPEFDCYLMSVYGYVPNVGQASSLSPSAPPNPDEGVADQPRSEAQIISQREIATEERFIETQKSAIGNLFTWCGHPKEFAQWHLFSGATLVAHNAAFDSLVFKRLQELGIIPKFVPQASSLPCEKGSVADPQINNQQSAISNPTWRCTASMSVYLSAPRSLKGACKQLLDITVDKTPRDKAKGQTGADLFGNDAMEAYALEDARLCYLLWDRFNPLWPEEEQELATLTFEWGQQGIAVNLQRLNESIRTLETQRFNAAQQLPWVDDLDEDTPLSHRKLAVECRKANIPCPASLAMDDPECEAWEDKYGSEYAWVDAMRIFRRTNMLLKRFKIVQARTRESDYRFPYGLKYFGAVPGRWSGDAGFNVQNMPRGELFDVDLRKCFVPAPGNVFIIADLCQIEPRILAWLIDDTAFLDLVREGVDIYEAHARSTMGYTDPRPLKEVDPDMRSLAKARTLGLGYGCGPRKFVAVAKNLGGIDITFAEAKQTVQDFRSKNPKITRLWNRLDRDFKRSAGGDYHIELPSGRELRYLSVAKNQRGYYTAATERGGRKRKLYGGLLTENLVQATARDVFAVHLLEIHRAQIGQIVFHVHDEVIVEVPEHQAQEACDRIRQIMSVSPAWLPDCPVAADAAIHHHYTK